MNPHYLLTFTKREANGTQRSPQIATKVYATAISTLTHDMVYMMTYAVQFFHSEMFD